MALILTVLLALAAAGGVYVFWARRVRAELDDGAAYEWEHLSRADPDLLQGLTQNAFSKLYHKVNFPRGPGYALACAAAIVVITPIALALINASAVAAQAIAGTDVPAGAYADHYSFDEEGALIALPGVSDVARYYAQNLTGFYLFFGLIASWVGVVWWFMGRYHRRRPGALREEILRAR